MAHNRRGIEKIVADVVERVFPLSSKWTERFYISMRSGSSLEIHPYGYAWNEARFYISAKVLKQLMRHDIPGAYEYVETQIAISKVQ